MILFAERTPIVRTPAYEAVRYDHNDKSMFVLVNLTDKPQYATVDGIDGNWHEFRHNRTINSNVFELAPFQTVIGTSGIMDAGLPTYEQTKALIDKLEYDRTHRGSLLFERHSQISVKNSPTKEFMSGHKLFDSVLDNYAAGLLDSAEVKFVELYEIELF